MAEELQIGQHEARTYLGRLAESGKIARTGRGLYTPVASVASVVVGSC